MLLRYAGFSRDGQNKQQLANQQVIDEKLANDLYNSLFKKDRLEIPEIAKREIRENREFIEKILKLAKDHPQSKIPM
ncbi:MAG: hypothetical protein A3B34_03425 [Candidatus Sungbacteria bacterium RIFCSPLOWO2_01_FULL_54_21]|uniref:Uncharacterized protein n=1 Tax=Candidatus Sungbacteria bacterium RIFCSPLOWO2_01_FULL_54_21 TaxID=1802279 RepID=A0A1G2L7R5_9BACT|nr:MAG: hypothetical protein A3B34_03425 [Candidatus Sungbacteria bacterium RIFCSPLOWO2_01_FULL_54_21]